MEKTTDTGQKDLFVIRDLCIRLLGGIIKYGWCIIIFALAGTVLSVGYTYSTYTPSYSATTTFTLSTDVSNNAYYNNNTAKQLEETFPHIITSSALSNIVMRDLNRSSLPGKITASSLENTNLFTITVVSSRYETAYDVLKSVLNKYPEVADQIIGKTKLTLISPPTASSQPINQPSYQTVALVGAGIGAVLGFILVFILTALRNTMHSADEITSTLHCHKLGSVLEVVQKKSSKKLTPIIITDPHVDSHFYESISSIRNTVIRKCAKQNIKSIMVTSTGASEGKTTISANLALSLAKKNYKTILVDGDLRNPSVKQQLCIDKEINGIDQVLAKTVPLDKAIVRLPDTNLYALLGTQSLSNASEQISSEPMKEILESLYNTFDFVIIDAPPAGIVSDAVSLKNDVDGLIFVIKQDYAKLKKIEETLDSFTNGKIKILGCIFNSATGILGSHNYGRYGYGRYGYTRYGYGRYGHSSYKQFQSLDTKKEETDAMENEEDEEI